MRAEHLKCVPLTAIISCAMHNYKNPAKKCQVTRAADSLVGKREYKAQHMRFS